jgi:hypothetical protein
MQLLGRKGMAFLMLDGFARRFVTTVDNLAHDHASPLLWPVNTTPGRFETEARADGTVISAKNAARYTAFVRFATSVDTGRAVGLYRRLYPLLQQAYEELGYPGKYFNDRVVEVIDHLLATPEVRPPIKVRVIETPERPRTAPLYRYEDPIDMETRSAGQKILVRVGPDNAAKLKAKLVDVRRRVARGPGARSPD